MRMRFFGLVDKAGAVAAVKANGAGSNPGSLMRGLAICTLHLYI
jgi:hypothetical protein